MAKLSKRAKAIREKVEAGKLYAAEEAFGLLKAVSSVKFSEAVDVCINLGVDPVSRIRLYVVPPYCLMVPARLFVWRFSPKARTQMRQPKRVPISWVLRILLPT